MSTNIIRYIKCGGGKWEMKEMNILGLINIESLVITMTVVQ